MTCSYGSDTKSLQVLLIEADSSDAELIRKYCEGDRVRPVKITMAHNLQQGLRYLREYEFDIIIVELILPDSQGPETFKQVRQAAPRIPVIVVANNDDAHLAAECMAQGAQDYLPKAWINPSLAMTIWNTVARTRTESALAMTRRSMSCLVEASPDGILVLDQAHVIQYANSAARSLFEGRLLVGEKFALPNGEQGSGEMGVMRRSGGVVALEVRSGPILWHDAPAVMVTLRDVTELKQARECAEHITKVLQGVRKVNQLITKAHDQEQLIQGVCDSLITSSSYRNAWIVLLDDKATLVAVACADPPQASQALAEELRNGEPPICIHKALKVDSTVVLEPQAHCGRCPLGTQTGDSFAMVQRLQFHGKTYGVMAVAIAAQFVHSDKEQGLFEELSGDVSFALYKIEIEQQRDRYAQIVAGSHEGMALVDRRYIYLETNPSYRAIVNWSGTATAGYHLAQILGEEFFQNTIKPHLDRCFAGENVRFEIMRPTPARTPCFIEALYSPCFAPDGSITAAAVCIRDITERKQSEELLRIRMRLLEFAETNSSEALLVKALDEIGTLTCSPIAFYRLLQPDHQNVPATVWSVYTQKQCAAASSHTHHCDLERAGIWAECIRQGRPVVYNDYATLQHRKALPPGHPVLKRILVVPVMRSNRTVAVLGVGNKPADYTAKDIEIVTYLADVSWEITEHKKVEDHHARLSTAIEQAGEMILITDPQGVIQYVNPVFERITGYRREEVIGKNPRFLKSGRHDEKFYQEMWRTISGGHVWNGRMVNKRKDGTLYTEETTISPVFNTAGEIINYVAIKDDITEHLKISAEKDQMAEQYRQAQKLESIGRLAGGVAHDFNNMLSIILGYGEIILKKLTPDDPLRNSVEQIVKAGERSAELTRQLLAFSRKQTLQLQVMDLNDLVRNLEKMLCRLIGEDIELKTRLDEKLAHVEADPGQIEQVIMNLAVNARDAMPQGGKLLIETTNVFLDTYYARNHVGVKPGDYVMLAISDTGCGMDSETCKNIFEPFFTTKEKGKGTGLGLSTVYGIVKQLRGNIWVYSEVGQGTTFKIYLPSTDAPLAQLPAPPEVKTVEGHGALILVVEDEISVRNLVQCMLENLHYKVIVADNGIQALNMVQQQCIQPDLLIIDVVMPEMGGRTLVERLRQIQPDLKVLYMSGYTDNAIVHHGLLDPGTPFLQKPFNIQELSSRVRSLLGENGLPQT